MSEPAGRARWDVYICGDAAADPRALAEAARRVEQRLWVAADQLQVLLAAGGHFRVRSGVSPEIADKLVQVLRESGIRAARLPAQSRHASDEDIDSAMRAGYRDTVCDITTGSVRAALAAAADAEAGRARGDHVAVALNLPPDLLRRAEALVYRLGTLPEYLLWRMDRAAVLRLALERGLDELELDHAEEP